MEFTTTGACANNFGGGWWYATDCNTGVNLNGVYGVQHAFQWEGFDEYLSYSEIKMRPT